MWGTPIANDAARNKDRRFALAQDKSATCCAAQLAGLLPSAYADGEPSRNLADSASACNQRRGERNLAFVRQLECIIEVEVAT